MPSRKTHRRKTHRRKTRRSVKKGGSYINLCQKYLDTHGKLTNKIEDATTKEQLDDIFYQLEHAKAAAENDGCVAEKRKLIQLQNGRYLQKVREIVQNGGGCESLRARFEALTKRVHLMRMPTYENKWSRVRALYNETAKKGNNADCAELARAIDEFENTVLKNETNKLMASQRR